MSHQVPDYYRYVSSIEIVNPGSGYTSVPTITISGGGGTGATATASIFNGQIQAVNITNIGRDYTSSPTVTATGGGGANATFNANLAFAAGTPTDYTEKSSIGIKYTLPEFIQNDYDRFVTFIEKYYEFMDSDGNPANLLLNKTYNDIDELENAELNKRAEELAYHFPQILQTDRKALLKKIKNIYESKGSERSIKAYFKLLYNEEVEVYYPSQNILRASDGVWIEETSVRATPGFNNYEVLELSGMLADIKYHETVGSVPLLRTIPVTIPRVEKLSYTSPQAYEVVLELPPGITEIPGPGAQATATATVVGGEITGITVVSGGYDYNAAPEVQIFDPIGTGAEARAVVSEGKVTSIVVTSGGSNYTGTNTTINLSTDNLRTFIVERGASSDPENIRAYLDRSLALVSSGTYSGDNAGFSVGDVFTVNESGDDGAAYAVDGYFAEDYTFSGGSNNAVIRVAAVDSKSVPTSWSIINPGEGFINSETVISIESKTGVSLDITFYTKYLYSYDGKYKDDRGKLSDVNRLQDNYKYQSYSYIIKSTVSQNQWVKKFREIMHPAGMEVFGDLIISSNINFAPFISITTQGLNLLEFKTEDIVISNSDELSINYSKPFANTTSNSDLFELLIESSKVDTVTTNDAGAVTYFAEDYCDLTYCREGGVEILVSKVFDEDTSTLDVFVPVMSYIRTFSDTSSAEDIGQVTYFAEDYCDPTYCSEGGTVIFVDKVLDEEILSAVDNFLYEKNTPVDVSDSVSATNGEITFELSPSLFCSNPAVVSEIPVININKELVENQTATESTEINTDKSLSETGTMSESVYITKQDYSDPTYFSEDYVGAVYSF